MNWLWIVPEYRAAQERITTLEKLVRERDKTIEDLAAQLQKTPVSFEHFLNELDEFKDIVFAEQPFPDNKIPEHFFLTPAGADR